MSSNQTFTNFSSNNSYESPLGNNKQLQLTPKTLTIREQIIKRISILQWLPKYTKGDVLADFVAGLTVGLTMMPQSIAYASLAGLPAQYGLYTAFIGSFTYIFIGTIKEVSIGPTSLMSLLTFSYVGGLPVDYTILLTFLVGWVELLMGIFKLGFLVDFISPCVTAGFTSAMAVTISLNQLKNIFGIKKMNSHGFFDSLAQLYAYFNDIRLGDTILGFTAIAFLFAFKQLPKIKARNKFEKKLWWFLSISRNACLLLITSVIAFCYSKYGNGAPFILSGNVPSGLPHFRLPNFQTKSGNETVSFVEMMQTFASGIIVLPLGAVVANVAIAKAFTHGVIVDATQEMVTLGLCNIFGACIQAMPSTGAFTRSAVASNSGVRTPLQGLYSGSVIILALSFLTPYFYYIPKATIAAVLISAVFSVFKYEMFPILWKINKYDFSVMLTSFICGVIFSVEVGILTGTFLNIIILLKLWVRPEITIELQMDNNSHDYIYIKPELGLYYPAADHLTTAIATAHNCQQNLPIVLDCLHLIRTDYAAIQVLKNLIDTYNEKYLQLGLLNLKSNIFKLLKNQLTHQNRLYICKDLNSIWNSNELNSNDMNASYIPLLNINVTKQ